MLSVIVTKCVLSTKKNFKTFPDLAEGIGTRGVNTWSLMAAQLRSDIAFRDIIPLQSEKVCWALDLKHYSTAFLDGPECSGPVLWSS